jgi:hypothetical protein
LGLPLAQLHCHWRGNVTGLIHSELYRNHPNVAMVMDVDHVMLMIAFDVHAEIKGDTPTILHLEPLLHLILNLHNQALVGNDKEIIDLQYDYSNNCGWILKHEQSSGDT